MAFDREGSGVPRFTEKKSVFFWIAGGVLVGVGDLVGVSHVVVGVAGLVPEPVGDGLHPLVRVVGVGGGVLGGGRPGIVVVSRRPGFHYYPPAEPV